MVFTVMGLSIGLSLVLTSYVTELWQLFLTYSLLLAPGTGTLYPSVTALTSRWFTRGRGLALGIVSAGGGVGLAVMTLVSNYFIYSYGWRTSYRIMGVIAFAVITPCALLLRRAPGEVAALPAAETETDKKPTAAREQHSPGSDAFTLSRAVKTPRFWLVFFAQFLLALCVYVILGHLVRHGIDLGISPTQAASVLSVIGMVSFVGRLTMGRVSDSIGTRVAFVASALVMAAGMVWLIWSSDLWMLEVFAIPFGFAWGAFSPLTAGLVADTFGLRHLGVIIGVITVGWGLGAAVGPAMAGYVFDTTRSYTPAFAASVIAAVMAAALLMPLKKPME